MNRMLKCCLCALIAALLLPVCAYAQGSDLKELAAGLESADSIDAQLALINETAESSDDLNNEGWDISLKYSLGGNLPDGLLPENYDDAVYVEELPDELKEGRIVAFYDDEGIITLLGDFMVRFSPERRADSLDSADIVLMVRHQDKARTDYIGSAYDRNYYGYMWRIGSGDIYQIFSKRNTPPSSGWGTLYGDSMSVYDLWNKMRFMFFTSKVITESTGGTTTYTLMNGRWTLSDLKGDRIELVVPGEIDGFPVEAVSKPIRSECPSLERIVLSEGVKYIEDSVFQSLDSLTDVTLPDGLVSIGSDAFSGCDSLTQLIIPDSVESIGEDAFSDMKSLEMLKLPAAPVDLGQGVVKGMNRIGSLALPEGLKDLPNNCFTESYGLSALYIPASVVNFPDSIPDWIIVYTPKGSPAQMWADKQGIATAVCDSADDLPQTSVEQEDQYLYVILDGEAILVDTIPEIQYVSVPDTFGGAPLTTIRHAFYNDNNAAYISIPEGVSTIGNDFCYSCDALEQIILPSALTQIGDNAFRRCDSITSLVLPEGLQTIGESFAASCDILDSVILPSGITELPADFLKGCSLTTFAVPDGVKKISSGALAECFDLYSLYLPESVVQIDGNLPVQVTIYAPEGSPALMWAESNNYTYKALDDSSQMPDAQEVTEGDFVYILYDGEALLRKYNGNDEVLVIPETLGGAPVTRILRYAIQSDYLTSVTVADSVRRLDYLAFSDNDGLEELYLPDTIEYMDPSANPFHSFWRS